jgi:hypothetical protein
MRRREASLARLEDRIGRALASVVNLLDPDVIVIGGGLSKLDRLYATCRALIERHLFGGGMLATPVLRAKHGDASGVRGAAWLWPAGLRFAGEGDAGDLLEVVDEAEVAFQPESRAAMGSRWPWPISRASRPLGARAARAWGMRRR